LFAGDYFELELDLQLVESIYEHRPLNSEIVYRLNPDADLEQLKIDLIEIGYASEIEK
jgi:hypothetical protein